MTTPVSTKIRQALPEGVWFKGLSTTYRDTSYTRTQKKTRWASKYLVRDMTFNEKVALKKKLRTELGPDYEVMVWDREVNVYTALPIQIVELDAG